MPEREILTNRGSALGPDSRACRNVRDVARGPRVKPEDGAVGVRISSPQEKPAQRKRPGKCPAAVKVKGFKPAEGKFAPVGRI